MKHLQLSFDDKQFAAGLKGLYATPNHYDHVIDEDAAVFTPSGTLLGILVRGRVPTEVQQEALAQLATVNGMPSNRSVAVYRGSQQPRIRVGDGMLSNTRAVARNVLELLDARGVRTGQLGGMDKSATRRKGQTAQCRLTSWTVEHPEVLDAAKRLILIADEVFREQLADRHAAQLSVVSLAPKPYQIFETAFSTITVNKNWRTAYHTDKGDLKAGFGVMLTLGDFSGGLLVFPRFRAAFNMRPGDVLLADVHQFHGNTQINGDRISCVMYCRQHIARCRTEK